jgi:transposase-like protein
MADAAHAVGLSLAPPRRRRSAQERRLIVEETLEAGSSVARVAMKHGVNANQVFKWRRLHETGRLGPRAAREVQLLPVRVAEEQELSRPEAQVAASAPSVGSAELPCLRPERAGTGAVAPHRSGACRTWAARRPAIRSCCRHLMAYLVTAVGDPE